MTNKIILQRRTFLKAINSSNRTFIHMFYDEEGCLLTDMYDYILEKTTFEELKSNIPENFMFRLKSFNCNIIDDKMCIYFFNRKKCIIEEGTKTIQNFPIDPK